MNTNGAIQIDQGNFKLTRESYGISVKDVAEKCHFAPSTVYNFEHCRGKYMDVYARSGNDKIMITALRECIDEKLAGLFVQKETIKKEEETVTEHEKNICLSHTIDKLMVRNAIVDWCNNNNVNVFEFCTMCGITKNILYDYKNHPYMYKSTVDKILAATGWTMDIFEKYKDSTEPIKAIQKEKGLIKFRDILEDVQNEVKKYVPESTADLMVLHNDTINYKKINRKLYFEDGKFYEEYDRVVTVHEKKEVTKEEFLTAVKEV